MHPSCARAGRAAGVTRGEAGAAGSNHAPCAAFLRAIGELLAAVLGTPDICLLTPLHPTTARPLIWLLRLHQRPPPYSTRTPTCISRLSAPPAGAAHRPAGHPGRARGVHHHGGPPPEASSGGHGERRSASAAKECKAGPQLAWLPEGTLGTDVAHGAQLVDDVWQAERQRGLAEGPAAPVPPVHRPGC